MRDLLSGIVLLGPTFAEHNQEKALHAAGKEAELAGSQSEIYTSLIG